MLTVKKCLVDCSKTTLTATRAMSYGNLSDFKVWSEPIFDYGPGSEERQKLEAAIKKYDGQVTDIPIVIGSEEIRTSDVRYQVAPFDHQTKIAKYHYASADLIRKAIDVGLEARKSWSCKPFTERAQVFLRAADLISGKYRMDMLATTMWGQAKTIYQAEVDAAAELVDFYRFNTHFGLELQKLKLDDAEGVTNSIAMRGMEGFWAAISPFNFTAIGGHLPVAPAMVGNVSLWKPSDTAMLSNWTAFCALREAGLPPGVINFLPAEGPVFGDTVTSSPHLAGINFTGSVRTFRHLWKEVGQKIDLYRTYPRLIGECGGKNFHFIHKSADVETVAIATYKSAFEFGGQKCSACSRLYVPKSLWPDIKQRMLDIQKDVKYGSPFENQNFLSAVIDDKSFDRIKGWLDHAKSSPNLSIVAGGNCDNSKGYFVEPTIVETTDPEDKIMKEEIFGPILTVYVYPDDQYRETAEKVDSTVQFALTGSIFCKDSQVTEELKDILRDATGNVYINDKSTGSIVGQQPFGGARLSGTNDKAGGPHYLLRFSSPQSTKVSHVEQRGWRYPSMDV